MQRQAHGVMSAALLKLWEAHAAIQEHEYQYWKLADELLEQRAIAIEDVATIYGIHPQTAAKRVRAMRDARSCGSRGGKPSSTMR